MTRAGQDYYLHADHQGSIVRVTDTAGTVVNSYEYDAYGRRLAATEGVALPYGYTGREFDPESGLMYYRARMYDPATGRFLQTDPIGFAAGDLNLYRYVFNNPVNLIDPDGTNPKKYQKPPNPNKPKGADDRQPGGQRERNVGHPDAEEHSMKAKPRKRKFIPKPRGPLSIPPLIFDLPQEFCRQGVHSGAGCLPENQPLGPLACAPELNTLMSPNLSQLNLICHS